MHDHCGHLVDRSFRRLDSTDDAIHLGRLAIGPATLVAALLEDRRSRQGIAVTVESDGDEGDELAAVRRIDELLCDISAEVTGRRLALVSLRPPWAPAPTLDDLDLWDRLVDRHRDVTLELLDWIILLGADGYVSLADELGPEAMW